MKAMGIYLVPPQLEVAVNRLKNLLVLKFRILNSKFRILKNRDRFIYH